MCLTFRQRRERGQGRGACWQLAAQGWRVGAGFIYYFLGGEWGKGYSGAQPSCDQQSRWRGRRAGLL